LRLFNTWRNQPLPVSASAWEAEGDTGVLRVRLSGSSPALRSAAKIVGGDRMDDAQAAAYWDSLRDQTHPFFAARPLWRLSLPPTTPVLGLGNMLIRSEEHTSELQSRENLVCRLLL